MIGNSFHSTDSEDMDQFFDAATFSFGSLASSDMPTGYGAAGEAVDAAVPTGVRFNPVVGIMGGCEIPLAPGDGHWDTLQYEYVNTSSIVRGLNAQESVMSLSLGEAFEDKTKAKFNPFFQQESLSSEISFTRDIATVQEEPDEGSWLRASVSESSTGAIQDFVRSRIEKADDRDHVRDFAAANANVAMKRESSRKLIGAVFPRRGASSAATQTLNKKVLQHVAIQAIKTANVTVASTASTMAVATVVAGMGVMAKLAMAATAVSVVVAGSMLGSSGATATFDATVSNPNEAIIASNGSQLLVSKVYSENTTVSQAVKAIEFEALVNVTTLQPVDASLLKKSKTMPPSVYGDDVTDFPSSSSTIADEDYVQTSRPIPVVPSNSSSTLTPDPPGSNGVSASERIATKVPLANDVPTVPTNLPIPALEATKSPQSKQPRFAIPSSDDASKIESTLASPRPNAPSAPEVPAVASPSPSSANASKIESTLASPRPNTPSPTTAATATATGKDSPPLTNPSAQLPSADGSDSMWSSTPNVAPSEVLTEFPSIWIKDSPAPLAGETTRAPLIDASTLYPFSLPTPQPSEVPTYLPQSSSQPIGEVTDFPSQQGSTKIPSSGPANMSPVRPTDAPSSRKPDRPRENPSMTPSWSKSMTPSSSEDRVINTSRPSNLPTDVPNEGAMDTSTTVPSLGRSDISADPTPSLTGFPTSLTTDLPARSEHPTAQPSLRPGDDGRAIPSPMPTNVLNGGASSSSAIPSVVQTVEVPEIFLPTDEGSSSPTAYQSNFPTTEFPSPVPDLTASTRPSEAPTEGFGSLSSQNPTSLPSQRYSEVPSSIEDDMLKTMIPSLSPSTSPRSRSQEPPMEPPAGISSHSPTQMPSVDFSKSDSPLSLPPRAPSDVSSSKPSRPADGMSSSPSAFSADGPSSSPTVIEIGTKPTIPPSQTGPSGSMTEFPSVGQTLRPTNLASVQPMNMNPASSQKPSTISSTNPSVYPVSLRSTSPIALSSQAPSISPTENTPRKNQNVMPSQSPATGPTTSPPKDESRLPSVNPSEYPPVQTAAPSNKSPVTYKSVKPSPVPTPVQSKLPSTTQSAFPTFGSSRSPSAVPSMSPTADTVSEIPSMTPSRKDSISQHPSVSPSVSPKKVPVTRFEAPSALPSRGPSNDATMSSPSNAPSLASSQPTTAKIIASKPPSGAPSFATSRFPSISPRASQLPTLAARPSSSPSLSPSTQSSDTGWPVSIPTSFAPITKSPSTDAPFVTIAPGTNGPATATPFAFAPVTNAPVTAAPLTVAPTTKSPLAFSPVTRSTATNAPLATLAPATNGPVTVSPITATPTTKAPTSPAPITKSPTASVPVATQAPATNGPATAIPIAFAPSTNGPITVAPMNAAPVTKSPTSAAPVTKLPTTSTPLATPSPATDGPVTVAPISIAPMTKSPKTSAPMTKFPTSLAPVTQSPATNAPLSTTAAPATNGPVSVAPMTAAPFTNGPVTTAPLTVAPVTKSPTSSTKSPATSSPLATLAPVTNGPVTAAPITIAPVSQSPMSLAPVTKAPLATTATPISTAPITNAPVVTMAPVVPMCTLTVTAPVDIMVQILQYNNVTLRNAETITVQSNVDIYYRVVGGREIFGNWTVHAVGTCSSPLDVTAAVSTVTFIVPSHGNVTVDVWFHTGKFYNGDSLNVPLHSTFEWRVQSDPDKQIFNHNLKVYHVGATGGIVNATPFVCTVTFKVPIDFAVEIQQTGRLYRNGDRELYPNHSGMSWRIRLDSGLVGGWRFHSIGTFGGVLDAFVATTLVPIVAIPNTQVNLKDHRGWLLNGDSVRLPLGVNVTWETVEGHPATFSVVRNTHLVTLGSVLNVAASTCALTIQAPANITVALNAYPGASFFGSDVVILAANTTLQWRTSSGGGGSASSSSIVGPWNTRAVDNCAIPLDAVSATCTLTIAAAPNSEIDVRHRAVDLVHGATILLPKNSTIEWRVKTNTFFGAYTAHDVGHCGSTPLDTSVSVCNLTVNTAPMGGHVEVFGWPHNLGMGATLQLPRHRTIFYRIRINGLAGPELSHNVQDCLVPLETAPNSCQIKVTGLPSASSWVDVPPQLTNLRTGDTFALPKDVTFNWTAHSSGVAATKTSDANGTTCTELDASSAFL